jgi:hypothetical protein
VAEPVPLAQFDTLAEPVMRTDHPSAKVFGSPRPPSATASSSAAPARLGPPDPLLYPAALPDGEDLRTGIETGNTGAVLDGDIDRFLPASAVKGAEAVGATPDPMGAAP